MVNLILTVMALVMGSAMLMAGMEYIPVGQKVRQQAADRVEMQLEALDRGALRYIEAQRDPATGTVDLGSERDTLMNDLAPNHVFEPRFSGGQWSAGVGTYLGRPGIWLCLSPDETEWPSGVGQAIRDVGQAYPEQAVILADGCGADTETNGPVLTYWRLADQHDRPGTEVLAPVSPPPPDDEVVLDEERAVAVQYGVQAHLEVPFNHDSPVSARAILEVQPPGDADWIVLDERLFRLEAPLSVDVILNNGKSADSTVSGEIVQTRRSSLQGVVPPKWSMRFRVTSDPEATLTLEDGHLQRFW